MKQTNTSKSKRWIRWNSSSTDIAIALIVVAAAHYLWRHHTIADLDGIGRRALYQQTTGVCATLFGFTLTGLGLLMASADKPLPGFPKGIPAPQRQAVVRTGFGLLSALATTLLIAFALLVVDTDTDARGFTHSLYLFFPALAAIKMLRVVRHLKVLVPPKPSSQPYNRA